MYEILNYTVKTHFTFQPTLNYILYCTKGRSIGSLDLFIISILPNLVF